MKLKNTSVYLLAGWMLAACSGGGFQKTENGVVLDTMAHNSDVLTVTSSPCSSTLKSVSFMYRLLLRRNFQRSRVSL